jgi:hypothetical protein
MKFIATITTKINEAMFALRCERSIYRICEHCVGEKRHADYPFDNRDEMNRLVERKSVRELLNLLDAQIPSMGKGYGETVRYLAHKEVYEVLRKHIMYAQPHAAKELRVNLPV